MGTRWVRPTTTTTTIAGGYTLIRSHAMLALWQSCQDGHLTLLDLRTALASCEIIHRAKTNRKLKALPATLAKSDTAVDPNISTESIRQLTACTDIRKTRAALKRLADAGVPPEQLTSKSGTPLHSMLRFTAGIADRPVPVPRRWLRALAKSGTAAMIATAMGHLLRGAFSRAGRVELGGTCSAGWLSEAFGIDERTAKAGRACLAAKGWIVPVPSPTWHRQRYGASFLLSSELPAANESRATAGLVVKSGPSPALNSPPRTPSNVPDSPPPKENKYLPYRGTGNQNHVAGRHSRLLNAASIRTGKNEVPSFPSMVNIQLDDLTDPIRTSELYDDAKRRELIGTSPADRLKFFTTVRHALEAGHRPCALFASLAMRGCWHFGTMADEDFARRTVSKLEAEGDAFRPPQNEEIEPPDFPDLSHLTTKKSDQFPNQKKTPGLQDIGSILTSLGVIECLHPAHPSAQLPLQTKC